MKKEWLIAGAMFGCALGASLSACSSTTGTGTTGTTTHKTTTTDTSSTSSGMGGMPTTTTTTDTSSTSSGTGGMPTSSSSGGTGNCSTVGTLHPPKLDAGDGTIYCPFSSVGDGGKNDYCTAMTEHCCETAAGSSTPSACQPAATACDSTSTDWQCQDPVADCTDSAKPVCCAPGASIGLGAPGCGNFAHTMKSTTCVATGACQGIIMCTSDGECPSGQHCTAFSKAGAQVGGCM